MAMARRNDTDDRHFHRRQGIGAWAGTEKRYRQELLEEHNEKIYRFENHTYRHESLLPRGLTKVKRYYLQIVSPDGRMEIISYCLLCLVGTSPVRLIL